MHRYQNTAFLKHWLNKFFSVNEWLTKLESFSPGIILSDLFLHVSPVACANVNIWVLLDSQVKPHLSLNVLQFYWTALWSNVDKNYLSQQGFCWNFSQLNYIGIPLKNQTLLTFSRQNVPNCLPFYLTIFISTDQFICHDSPWKDLILFYRTQSFSPSRKRE